MFRNTSQEMVDQLHGVESKLLGITSQFEEMHEVLKARMEAPDVKKYVQQSAACEQTTKSDFYVIAAQCGNRGIGIENRLPWRLRNEMLYFERMTKESSSPTLKNICIMGRKTWSSIPAKYRPMKDRTNVVLSRQVSTIEDRDLVDHIFSSLPDALEGVSQLRNKGQVWVIGGQAIYEEALKLPQCKRIYLTKIDKDFECDTFFPKIDEGLFNEIDLPEVPRGDQEEGGIKYRFHVYERI